MLGIGSYADSCVVTLTVARLTPSSVRPIPTTSHEERPTDEIYADAEKLHAVEYFRLEPNHTPEAEKKFTTQQKMTSER